MLDVSSFAFPIVSGSLDYMGNAVFGGGPCGGGDTLSVDGNLVSFSPSLGGGTVDTMRIVRLHLVDSCGSTFDFDPSGATGCTDIRGTGPSAGVWDLTCSSQTQPTCPDHCS